MKYFFWIMMLSVITVQLRAQTLVGVAGNNLASASVSVDYAIGEVSISTLTSTVTTTEVTQGYLQPFITAIANPIGPFKIPNAFSPNGDNINDTWIIPGMEAYRNTRVTIFDRYGRILYNQSGLYKAWDGTINGKVCPIGVYYFIVEPEMGKQRYSGWLLLLR